MPERWSFKADIENPAKGFGNNPVVSDVWWKELSSQVRQAKEYCDMLLKGPNGNEAIVRTGWILRNGSDVYQLTTAFIL